MAETLGVTLSGMAYGGDALGRSADGRVIFVPFGLPGEEVRVELTEVHKSWARARLAEVLTASPDRTAPRCRHFGECGGCHYQHMTYAAQLKVKADIVRAQLERLGGLKDPPVEATLASPSPWNSRNHLQFSLTAEGRLGFQAAGTRRVIPISECHLPEPDLADLWPKIAVAPVPGLRRVALRSGGPGEKMIILQAETEPEIELTTDLPASIVWLSLGAATVLAGRGFLITHVLGRPFRVSAASFFQVNTSLVEELVREVLKFLTIQPGELVFDLYAGVGLFSAFAAQAGARLLAVEDSPGACEDFEVNLEEFDDVELYQATVEATLPALSQHPDAMVLDPPRAGLGARLIQHAARLAPPRLVYVSCDPATLARDGRGLAQAGYHLEVVVPIDLFPQTFHIETISFWRR